MLTGVEHLPHVSHKNKNSNTDSYFQFYTCKNVTRKLKG